MPAGSTLNITMRPHGFDDVIGLEEQVAAIRKKIADDEIPRATILKGPFGCGKTTLAYIIAREIQGWEFSGVPQVQEINAANITGVDAMRKLVDSAGSYPMVGKYGVIILDEAHKLSKPAQELLLKEFEVPKSPTVWIICTSEYDKLIEGIRAGRAFTLQVRGMEKKERDELIARAIHEIGFQGDADEFVAAVDKAKLSSPRKILMAFETFAAGIPAKQAVGAMTMEALPEYYEIAMGVVFGQWDKAYDLFGRKKCDSVADQLKKLDDNLKKKPKTDAPAPAASDAETEEPVEEDDVAGRPETATALRAITAAILKGQVYKGGVKAQRAAAALFKLAHCISPNPADAGMEFACTIGGLYEVNQKMQGK